jgi:hypothetical protein
MMESDNCKIGRERTTVVNVLKAVGLLRKKQRSSKTVSGLCEGHARAAWFVFVVSKIYYTEKKENFEFSQMLTLYFLC